MVLMFDNIHFSDSPSLHGGSDLINIDVDFLQQMNEYSFFKDEIHITLSRDQVNRFPVNDCMWKTKGMQFFFLLSSLLLTII